MRTTYSSSETGAPAGRPLRVVLDYRPALRSRTGVGEYTHELASALLAGGHCELTLFSSSWKDRLALAPELGGATPIDLRIPVAALNLSWHRLTWPPIELMTGRRFEVTHSLHPLILPTRHAARVVTIHDLDFLTHPERTAREIRRDYPVLARQHAQAADAVLVPSAYTRSEVDRLLGVGGDRVVVCSPGAPDWRPRTGLARDGYLLFFGTLEPRKNVGTLLDAYERLLATRTALGRTTPRLVLAGGATADAAAWLARIKTTPLSSQVEAVGYVDSSRRKALYESAMALVVPSHDEGFGIPALEAMTLGVPVVAARRGALPEVLGGAGVLIDPDDAVDLAAGLGSIIDDEMLAEACTTRGLARAATYRWQATAARACDAYREAAARRARQPAS